MSQKPAAVAHAAWALAQQHKKASRYHRRAAKEAMENLRKLCEAHGIRLSIITGGGKHGPQDIARA